jgi:uncharacterized membrane protein YphA (DoxX/SURF4 family)
MTQVQKIIHIGLRLIAAIILLQTLYFKFSAAPESVYIFSTLGIEPVGRIASGVAELVAAILLLIPRTAWLGAGLSWGIMSGAIFSHFTKLGIAIQGDGGFLFALAIVVWVACAGVLWLQREEVRNLITKIYK